MRVEYEIIPEQRLIRVRCGETMRLDDFQDYIVRRNADPRYDPTYRRLLDATRLDRIPASNDVRGLADRFEDTDPEHSPIAVVAARDAVYGMFRMLETLSGLRGYPLRAFRTMEEAEEWLGLGEGPP